MWSLFHGVGVMQGHAMQVSFLIPILLQMSAVGLRACPNPRTYCCLRRVWIPSCFRRCLDLAMIMWELPKTKDPKADPK